MIFIDSERGFKAPGDASVGETEKAVQGLLAAKGALYYVLPWCSPELNPIERWLRAELRKLPTTEDVGKLVLEVSEQLSGRQDIAREWYEKCNWLD